MKRKREKIISQNILSADQSYSKFNRLGIISFPEELNINTIAKEKLKKIHAA